MSIDKKPPVAATNWIHYQPSIPAAKLAKGVIGDKIAVKVNEKTVIYFDTDTPADVIEKKLESLRNHIEKCYICEMNGKRAVNKY
jgi:hypothetical protein